MPSFLERLARAMVRFGNRILGEAEDVLEGIEELPEPEAPKPSIPQRIRRRIIGPTAEELREENERLQRENERLRAENFRIRSERERQRRAQRAADRRRQAAEERRQRFPRRVLGRLPEEQWTEPNRRIRVSSFPVARAKYNDLRRAGVPQALLAVVIVRPDLWDLFVGGS